MGEMEEKGEEEDILRIMRWRRRRVENRIRW